MVLLGFADIRDVRSRRTNLLGLAEDPIRPYVTTVEIAGREYGRGAYINKKQSKVLQQQRSQTTSRSWCWATARLISLCFRYT
jgi:hypothetical protein